VFFKKSQSFFRAKHQNLKGPASPPVLPNSGLSLCLSTNLVGAIINRPRDLQRKSPLPAAMTGVLQSAANLLITIIAGGNYTLLF